MTQAKNARRTQAQWQSLVDAQAKSGQSAKRFCEDHVVAYASFCGWRQRLGQHPDDTVTPLIDLTALMSQSRSGSWHIELDLGGGIKLNLSQG
jgi:hypothetical protein